MKQKTLIDNFTIFNNKVWELKISHSAKLVLICLYSYADKSGYCYPSYSNLSKRTNYSRAIIAKALKELESLELLRKETKFNNRYWLRNLTSLENELVQKLNSISSETEPILVQKLNCNYTNELNHITKPDFVVDKKKEMPTHTLANIKKKKDNKFVKPTIQEIADYIKEKNYSIDANKFFNYYEATNWYRGKTKISSWKACINTWLTNEKETPTKQNTGFFASEGK